jgi:nucleoside-diphosphate-sugar epimerase
MHKVLVTGANGFIGRALCSRLLAEGWRVRGTVRSNNQFALLPDGVEPTKVDSIGLETDWENTLEGVNTVVHLAARVHVRRDSSSNPFAEYRKVNVMGSKRLALTAAECGVKRFIFMSSVKVSGEENVRAYKEEDAPAPKDSYGISKMLAEERIKQIATDSGMDLVILRPPLVFGPGVKANFLELMKIVDKGTPLPLAKVDNRRSFIYIENLVDAVLTCIKHSGSAGKTFFVSDNEDVSTPELIRKTASALKKPARLFPCPRLLLFILGRIAGKGAAVDRLIGSLTVDISKIRSELGWKPPFTMEHGLQKTTEWYLNDYRNQKK